MHKYFQGDEARIPWATDPFREKLPYTEAWISINSIEDSFVSNLVLTVTQWFRTFSSLTWCLFQTFMCPVVKHIPKSTFSNSDPLFSFLFEFLSCDTLCLAQGFFSEPQTFHSTFKYSLH